MTRRESEPDDSVLDRRLIGWALGGGGAVVVLYELAALLASAIGGPEGMERGAVWTILLMIVVTFLTIGGIGWGLYSALRDGDSGRGR